MQVPAELASRFKFARQKSKLAGTIRGSYFAFKDESGAGPGPAGENPQREPVRRVPRRNAAGYHVTFIGFLNSHKPHFNQAYLFRDAACRVSFR